MPQNLRHVVNYFLNSPLEKVKESELKFYLFIKIAL